MSERPPIQTILRERSSEILASWIVRFERSPLRFRRATKAATHTAQVAALVESLCVAAGSQLQPGSDATRELERSAAFLGAQFASEGATGYDIAALLLELREVVASLVGPEDAVALTRLFEWLTVVALDGFAASGLQSLREKVSDQLEVGTPVVELLPKVPAVFLVGAPTASVLDNLLSRAWMLAVGTGAPCLIIDCAGLAEVGERNFDAGYKEFLEQAEGSALQVLLSGARRPLRERTAAVTQEHGLALQHFDRVDSAVAHAVERAGYLLMRRT
ncbi:MAG: RsbRD N-terminal domain-containing protein [Deltaproteobacteria bacterium]|nr:RsbRD N-terminal domain-containing protein [Deltaproteobacteria bacterium]MCW5802813.1 RsbRD N-terminal domain-containing protein [Deltaproteobacteria bacterium]